MKHNYIVTLNSCKQKEDNVKTKMLNVLRFYMCLLLDETTRKPACLWKALWLIANMELKNKEMKTERLNIHLGKKLIHQGHKP